MPISRFDESLYNDYVLFLRNHLNNDITINTYLRDLITTLGAEYSASFLLNK